MHRIVLTGGPCGGKTSAIPFLYEKLSEEGLSVVCVPAIPTLLISGGVSPAHLTSEQRILFQENILKMQMDFEDGFADGARLISKDPEKTILLYDRGCPDIKAYLSADEFKELLRRNKDRGWSDEMFLSRYDAVFHMVTAADGAEECYTLENNSSRKKSPACAREKDKKTFQAWADYPRTIYRPHLRAIDNTTDFDWKLKRLLHEVQHFLGIPETLEIERKFLLKPFFAQKTILCLYQQFMIEQCYLKKGSDGATRRLRKRWEKNSGEAYFYTKKVPTGRPGVQRESERRIDAEEYDELKKEADPNRDVIVKQRLCFFYRWQYFELDVFLEPERIRGLSVLELELTKENHDVVLPDFLKVQREVTEEKAYSNANLAKKDSSVRV